MDESPGWEAIDAALRGLYGDVTPLHLGTVHKWALGGPDPLDGISVYPRAEPVPHWHFISYGMSELYEKVSDNPDESGWGFEFTFRAAREPDEEKPPMWPASLLQNLGRYVYTSGNWFESGHHINPNGPIQADNEDSEIRGLTFITDPELGAISTPHGRVEFLQVVGLAMEEYEALRQWRPDGLLQALSPHLPLYVTDVNRRSLMSLPDVARAVEEGKARDGSSDGFLYVDTAEWERGAETTTVRMGAVEAAAVVGALQGRLPFGRALILETDSTRLAFHPGDAFAIEEPREGVLDVYVPQDALDDLKAAIRPTAGRTAVPSLPGLTVEIVPTVLKDRYGNETGKVVG
ncbi:MAG TPA: suppressor of fused domain protein [Vulgatibacteraceae bacterium]|nr:suppressor of fused domain protein [Vulgatibacteraceae bacterium]